MTDLAQTDFQRLIEAGRRARKAGDRQGALAAYEAAAACDPKQVNVQVEIAALSRESGHLDEAETALRRVLSVEQNHFGALVELGHVQRRRGDRTAALASFKAASAVDPRQLGVMVEIATELHQLERPEEAETLLRDILAGEPRHFGALVGLGHVLRRRGDRPASLTSFEAASAADPGQTGVKMEIAADLRELGRIDEAEALLRSTLASEPNNFRALVELGHVLRRRGNHPSALAAFESAAATEPRRAAVKMEVAAELRELGRVDEAEALLRSVLASEPKHFRALVELGHVLRRRGDRHSALTNFEAALAVDPRQLGLKVEVASELRELGRTDEAETLLRAVLASEPRHFRALVELGHLLRRRGDRPAALACFEAASAAAPRQVGATIEITTELRELGRVAEAEALLRRALIDEPKNAHALAALGSLLIEPFRLSEAETLFNEVVKLAPTNPAGHMGLGFVARRRGDRPGALTHFRSALAIDPRHAGATLETAAELRDQGNFNEAHELINALIEKQPTLIQARMQRGYVYRHQGHHEFALKTFESVLQEFPDHIQALVEMAFEQRALARPRETERLLRKAIDRDPRHLGALVQLAEYSLLSEDYETCLAICQRAMNAWPNKLAPYLLASRAANELGRRDEAADFLRQAREKVGANPEIKAVQVAQLRQARDWSSAHTLLRENPDHTKTYFSLWSQLMQVLISTGEYAAAEEAFNEAPVNTAVERSLASLFRGQIAEAQWRLEEAAAHYKDAIAFNPGHGWAHAEAARINLKLLDLDASRTHVTRMTELDASARLLRAQSTNASQTHIGQLIDEFSLDSNLLQELKQIRQLPVEQQLPPLRNIVRNNADHTPAAIMLFIALRQAGLLNKHVNAPGAVNDVIPRRIIQYWDETLPPDDIRALMNSWIELHPDFEYVRFDDARARQFLKENHSPDILHAYIRAREPAQKADLFRLAYLSVKGGFYIDADDLCIEPIHTFVSPSAHFATYQEDYGTLANNFLGAKINHPAIRLALARGVEAINRGDRDLLWLSTGPALLTRAFAQLIAASEPGHPDMLGSAVILDLGVLQRYVGLHCAAQYKKTEKHWGRSSFGRVIKPTRDTRRVAVLDENSKKTPV